MFILQEHRGDKRPLMLVRVPREHDLVLEMDSVATRRKFLLKLDTFLGQHKKALNLTQVNSKWLAEVNINYKTDIYKIKFYNWPEFRFFFKLVK